MRTHVAVGAITAALLGCGGGAPALVDETPPAVVSTSPAEGASEVRVAEPIVVRFSEPVRPTFTATLYAGGTMVPLPAEAVALEDSGREVRVTPPRTLALPQAMRLVLAHVVDRFDNPLAGGDVDLHFQYPAWFALGPSPCNVGAEIHAAPGSPVYATNYLCVARWTGSAWEQLPESGADYNMVSYAAEPDGGIAACFHLYDGSVPVVQRWVDGAWSTLPSLTRPGVTACAIASIDGVLHVAVRWPVGTDQWHVVYRFTDGGWQEVGDEVVTSTEEALTLHGGGGTLTLATDSTIHTLSADRTAWSLLPSPGDWYDIGQSSVGPVVAGDGAVMQYAAGVWTTLGSTSELYGLVAVPGAQPLMVKNRGVGDYSGYYRQLHEWDGVAWRALGPEMWGGPFPDHLTADSSGRVFYRCSENVFEYNR